MKPKIASASATGRKEVPVPASFNSRAQARARATPAAAGRGHVKARGQKPSVRKSTERTGPISLFTGKTDKKFNL